MYKLTEEHKKLIEDLPDISKVYGVYTHRNKTEYLRVMLKNGGNSTRGLKSTLIRCGIYISYGIKTCLGCKDNYGPKAANQLYCSDSCRSIARRNQVRINGRKSVITKYGLTVQQYDEMLAEQKNLCKICKKEPKRIVIDHNHNTGDVRGLLCVRCNSCLGWFETYGTEAKGYLASVSSLPPKELKA